MIYFLKVKFLREEVNENNNNSDKDEAYCNNIIQEQRLLAIYGSKTIQCVNLIINYYKDRYVNKFYYF